MRNKRDEIKLLELLKIFSPGTAIRSALDDILNAHMGALIVIDNGEVLEICDGGFRINSKFSSQKLVELAKMDGAIILSDDLRQIIYANTLLSPDVKLSTKETGTRHKAAERTAKHTGAIVVAVSERKNKITIYCRTIRYELENSSEILRRATETLQILEKQKETLNDLLINLNVLEINNIVTISDVCLVLQRIEIIKRISDMVKRYLIELGKEGIIVSMRLKELTRNLIKERNMILEDYFRATYSKIDFVLEEMSFDFLLEENNISKELFEDSHDREIFPRGIRILSKIGLRGEEIEILANNFKDLTSMFSSDLDGFVKIFGDENIAKNVKNDLDDLRERIMSGKRV